MSPVHSRDSFLASSKERRDIPGPLGMLSRTRSNSKNDHKSKNEIAFNDESANLNVSDCDVSSSRVDVVWDKVVRLFGSESWKIFIEYTIDKIIENAGRGLLRGKIPVLCASIEKIDTALPIAKAVLQDKTGKIVCTIDKSAVHKYGKFLCIGAVLVLKQISLFSQNNKTFYLNITPLNVTRIFLDENTLDSRLLASARTLGDVTVCGPNFPLTQPPLSLEELRNLVSECLPAPSPPPPPPPAPSSPPISSSYKRDLIRYFIVTPRSTTRLVIIFFKSLLCMFEKTISSSGICLYYAYMFEFGPSCEMYLRRDFAKVVLHAVLEEEEEEGFLEEINPWEKISFYQVLFFKMPTSYHLPTFTWIDLSVTKFYRSTVLPSHLFLRRLI
ncbi:hypothetical protein Aperf_G00000034369 [Anoplocephala perfoliata]